MREENGPAVANELVEVDIAMGRLRIKVGSYIWSAQVPNEPSRSCNHTSSTQTQTRLFLGDIGDITAEEGLSSRQLCRDCRSHNGSGKGGSSPRSGAQSTEGGLGENRCHFQR